MLTKHLFTISLLLPFMAISSAVHADHNYQHRPNQPAAYGASNQAGPAPAASNIGKDAHRCNNAIRGRHAPTKGARNPGCGPVDKRRPLRTSSLLLTLMATLAAAYAGSTIGGTIMLCTLAGAALGPRYCVGKGTRQVVFTSA